MRWRVRLSRSQHTHPRAHRHKLAQYTNSSCRCRSWQEDADIKVHFGNTEMRRQTLPLPASALIRLAHAAHNILHLIMIQFPKRCSGHQRNLPYEMGSAAIQSRDHVLTVPNSSLKTVGPMLQHLVKSLRRLPKAAEQQLRPELNVILSKGI